MIPYTKYPLKSVSDAVKTASKNDFSINIAFYEIIGNVQILILKLTKANIQYIELLLIRMTELI